VSGIGDLVLEQLPVPVAVAGPDGRLVRVNAQFARLTDLEPAAHAGRRPGDVLGAPALDAALAEAARGRTGDPVAVPAPAGGRTFAATLTPLTTPDGGGAGVLVTLAETTARERAERGRADAEARLASEHERHRAVIEAAPDAIVTIDVRGVIRSANPSCRTVLGWAPDELVGRHVGVLMPEPDRSAHDGYVARYLATGEARIIGRGRRVVARRRDGTTIPVNLAVGELVVGGERLFTGLIRDVGHVVEAERAVRRHAAEQAGVARIATASAAGRPPEEVFAVVAEESARAFDASAAALVRFDGGACVVVGAAGPPPGPGAEGAAPPARLGAAARVAEHGRETRLDHPGPTGGGIVSEVAAPVAVGGRLWGALSVAAAEPLPPWTAERLAVFAQAAAAAISAADARDRLRRQATTDPLTGLANHRVFHQRLRAECERAWRHGRELSLVVMDLDRFKEVNDALGHQAGDRVLADLARGLAELARPGDLMARLGGDEFGWILPETPGLGAHAAAERARALVAASPVPELGFAPTLSAGVSDLRRARTADELVRLADGALYWAKANGRDAVYLYSPEVVRELSAQERAQRLVRQQALAGLRGLARAIDAKDSDTRQHSERVAELAARLAESMGWAPAEVALLREAALVHDVGKIGVPDSILSKPGRLDAAEYDEVKRHAALGADIAREVLTDEQVAWIRHHHERFDGAGYPDGLDGTAIPLGARILAVADAWDVMTNVRAYRAPRGPDDAMAECARVAGTQLCPDVVAALGRLAPVGAAGGRPG
jgi:diguanylate cyclase (GGDEF)-like protein/PAS domain S-box-containing protein/putative nucleotidyltransferase with HDIG domain